MAHRSPSRTGRSCSEVDAGPEWMRPVRSGPRRRRQKRCGARRDCRARRRSLLRRRRPGSPGSQASARPSPLGVLLRRPENPQAAAADGRRRQGMAARRKRIASARHPRSRRRAGMARQPDAGGLERRPDVPAARKAGGGRTTEHRLTGPEPGREHAGCWLARCGGPIPSVRPCQAAAAGLPAAGPAACPCLLGAEVHGRACVAVGLPGTRSCCARPPGCRCRCPCRRCHCYRIWPVFCHRRLAIVAAALWPRSTACCPPCCLRFPR